jgi:hypothetical protein
MLAGTVKERNGREITVHLGGHWGSDQADTVFQIANLTSLKAPYPRRAVQATASTTPKLMASGGQIR